MFQISHMSKDRGLSPRLASSPPPVFNCVLATRSKLVRGEKALGGQRPQNSLAQWQSMPVSPIKLLRAFGAEYTRAFDGRLT